MKSGFNQISNTEFVYKFENYPGPIAVNATPSKKCKEYHEKSCIQINMGGKTFLKKVNEK